MLRTYLWRLRQLNRSLAESRQASLSELLTVDHSRAQLFDRMLWLTDLCKWLKADFDLKSPGTRLDFLNQVLKRETEWRNRFSKTLASLFAEASFLNFFAETGISHEQGLWSDVSTRVFLKFMPALRGKDLSEIVFHVFRDERDFLWIRNLPKDSVLELIQLASHDSPLPWKRVLSSAEEALLLLSINVAQIGVSQEVRRRLENTKVSEISFSNLAAKVQVFLSTRESAHLLALIERCHNDVSKIQNSMDSEGVSVGLVNRVEVLNVSLDRIALLAAFLCPATREERVEQSLAFLEETGKSALHTRSLRKHVGRHFYLLSKKIAERNGYSGEHVITRTPKERRDLLTSSIKGGAIVVGMTFLKTIVLRFNPAPLILAVFMTLVYASGFLLMQFSKATLATKLPSFMASHLAAQIKNIRSRHESHLIQKEMRGVLFSQGIALLGNLIGLVPLVLLAGLFLKKRYGLEFMDVNYAHHLLSDLNPLHGGACLFLSALTGFELWLSSLCGGWFENWVVFERLPQMIAEDPRLKRIFGPQNSHRFSKSILKNSSGIAANISLGFLFGFVPLLGSMLRVDLYSQHVTIATASALFAASSLDFHVPAKMWILSAVGLLSVGIMNLLVSFSMALFVASRAQNVKRIWFWHVLKSFRQ